MISGVHSRRVVATGRQSQSRGRVGEVVQAGGGGSEPFGSAQLRHRRSHRAGSHELARGSEKAPSDAQRRVPTRSDDEQLSRTLRAGADQSVPQFGHPRISWGEAGTIDIRVRASGNRRSRNSFRRRWLWHDFAVRHQAFNPFFTTRREQGCTGLGLHIVHNIVTHRLGGRLSLDSEPGKGTRIQLVLPRVAPAKRRRQQNRTVACRTRRVNSTLCTKTTRVRKRRRRRDGG